VVAGEIADFEPLQSDLDLRPPVSIMTECTYEFPVDSFCTLFFRLDVFDDTFLFLFLYVYRRYRFSQTPEIENGFSDSIIYFLEMCYHTFSYRVMAYVIRNRNPYEEGDVRRWQETGSFFYPLYHYLSISKREGGILLPNFHLTLTVTPTSAMIHYMNLNSHIRQLLEKVFLQEYILFLTHVMRNSCDNRSVRFSAVGHRRGVELSIGHSADERHNFPGTLPW
jgi:hypothetical protein